MPARGDFNSDNQLDDTDIDLLTAAMRGGEPWDPIYDLNRDTLLDFDDLNYLVQALLDTTFGDANLDGVFGSDDFILVFQVGEYEDGVLGNSGWSDGDWNGDGDFSSDDIVLAFQYGEYSTEARPAAREAAAIDGYFANLRCNRNQVSLRFLGVSAPSAVREFVKRRACKGAEGRGGDSDPMTLPDSGRARLLPSRRAIQILSSQGSRKFSRMHLRHAEHDLRDDLLAGNGEHAAAARQFGDRRSRETHGRAVHWPEADRPVAGW